jgi:hypothetical protein
MGKQAPMVQYTVRGVPQEVGILLKRKAARHKVSLNQWNLDELSEAARGARKRADFSDLVGKWIPDTGFDEIVGTGSPHRTGSHSTDLRVSVDASTLVCWRLARGAPPKSAGRTASTPKTLVHAVCEMNSFLARHSGRRATTACV